MRFFSVTLSLTAVILLFLTGCSDSAVIDSVKVNELQKPIIINEEPEHLATEFDEIMMDLSTMAVPDSAKLVQAWTLAFELAKYDGPMSEVFEALDASARGDSTWSPVKDRRLVKPVIAGKITPCEQACRSDYSTTYNDIMLDSQATAVGCGFVGAVAAVLSGGVLTPVIALGLGYCMISVAWNYWRDMNRAERDLNTCIARCNENGG